MGDVQLPLGDALHIGYAPQNIANKELKWETTTQYNGGLDFGFFTGRLNLSLDLYYKLTTDLLAQVDLPPSAGFTSSTQNIGSVTNQGFEVFIDAVPVTGNFRWDISANFYRNKNKIKELAKGTDVFAPSAQGLIPTMHILREGEPISMFYGYIWDGCDENTGLNTYKDLNNDGELNDLDRTILGSPHPDFNLGITNTFSYKNLQLSFLFEGSFGFSILNAALYDYTNSFSKGRNQLSEVAHDYWTPTNLDAQYPIPSVNFYIQASDRFIEDGTYLKLRFLNLSYALPVQNVSWLQNLKIYFSGQNLLTFTNYPWFDPEISQHGSGDLRLSVDNKSYPQVRTYSIGLKVGF
jgi:hypothetical protein